MKKKINLYENCNPYICYENTFSSFVSDIQDVVFVQKHGKGIIIKDFFNYYYKVTNITVNEFFKYAEKDIKLMIVGKNIAVNIVHIDTLTSKYIQIGEHLIPIDATIKQNLTNYQKLIFDTKEEYDKICDRAGKFEDDERNRWDYSRGTTGTDSLYLD